MFSTQVQKGQKMKVRNWKKYDTSKAEFVGTTHKLLEVNTLLDVTLDKGMEDLNLQMVITHDINDNLTIGKLVVTHITYGYEKKDEWSDITELYDFSVKECWQYFHHIVREYIAKGYQFYSLADMDIFNYYPCKPVSNRVKDMYMEIRTNNNVAFRWYMATPYEKRNYFKLELNY